MGISARGQSLDGDSLDLAVLDERVYAWKAALNLLNLDNFPPDTYRLTEAGARFHDRSHILMQDFLGMSSEDIRQVFDEPSMPSVYEEILTFFCAQIANDLVTDPIKRATLEKVDKNIEVMNYIGYLGEDSIFFSKRKEIKESISQMLKQIVNDSDFEKFRKTLLASTLDSPGWNILPG